MVLPYLTLPLELSHDYKRIVKTNAEVFKSWFNSWLVSYVPTLIERPKWFEENKGVSMEDIVLFLKFEQECDSIYQYGIVRSMQR